MIRRKANGSPPGSCAPFIEVRARTDAAIRVMNDGAATVSRLREAHVNNEAKSWFSPAQKRVDAGRIRASGRTGRLLQPVVALSPACR
jgi:hypothetical protein